MTVLGVAKAPCKSCPYRRDVPSGVWDASEYEKLPGYDGDVPDQLAAGAFGLFHCHQRDGNLCAGWLACHGPHNLLAMRLSGAKVTRRAWDYRTAIPLFGSGQEAAEHGLADIDAPGERALAMIHRFIRRLR
jgi:hypothetical protein